MTLNLFKIHPPLSVNVFLSWQHSYILYSLKYFYGGGRKNQKTNKQNKQWGPMTTCQPVRKATAVPPPTRAMAAHR